MPGNSMYMLTSLPTHEDKSPLHQRKVVVIGVNVASRQIKFSTDNAASLKYAATMPSFTIWYNYIEKVGNNLALNWQNLLPTNPKVVALQHRPAPTYINGKVKINDPPR